MSDFLEKIKTMTKQGKEHNRQEHLMSIQNRIIKAAEKGDNCRQFAMSTPEGFTSFGLPIINRYAVDWLDEQGFDLEITTAEEYTKCFNKDFEMGHPGVEVKIISVKW
jgi:hypothetical protein